jgi:hypothetical protein
MSDAAAMAAAAVKSLILYFQNRRDAVRHAVAVDGVGSMLEPLNTIAGAVPLLRAGAISAALLGHSLATHFWVSSWPAGARYLV